MALLQNKSPFQVLKVGFPDPDRSLVFLDLYYLACEAQTYFALRRLDVRYPGCQRLF